MPNLHYAKDIEGKRVYAFMNAKTHAEQVEKLNLVPVTAVEACKLYGKNVRQFCNESAFHSKTRGFVLELGQKAYRELPVARQQEILLGHSR
jgi:hypothetical protein